MSTNSQATMKAINPKKTSWQGKEYREKLKELAEDNTVVLWYMTALSGIKGYG